MKSADIRQAFLDYFAAKSHQVVPSSSLIPGNDPTLLFTNAGMVPFKDVFLGDEQRGYRRATSSQRCVRAGGKHNDLENVGYTARHHTFFEMLGNFSFGDYFKQDAIRFAWDFLTKELRLPEEKLWVTVHVSDDEAADIWFNEIGIDKSRFSRLDEDNFWQMGDTGPCGPSSEIFYDHGEDVPGGPPGSENDDLDRYIEIWNLVFMQYERQASGELVELPNPSIDTGMGLERIAAVMQGVHNNYDIDIFQGLLKAAAKATGCEDLTNKSLRVIADHIRSCSFLICDGVMPSNEGRGYVLRRIIRRAVRHGYQLGQSKPFFYTLIDALAEQMGDAYPELNDQHDKIAAALKAEEEQFARTLEKGLSVLDAALDKLEGTVIPGDVIFQLYDTYGFPTDLTNDLARERGLSLDLDGYEQAMNAQRERARAAGSFKVDYTDAIKLDSETEFCGYDALASTAKVVAVLKDGEQVASLSNGDDGIVVLDVTPFYGESGGQVGDTGRLFSDSAELIVNNTTLASANQLHHIHVKTGGVKVGDELTAEVDSIKRRATALNHSATHLLHATLRAELGEHVMQKGSMVNPDRLRFDFANNEALSPVTLRKVEAIVNQHIRANTPVRSKSMSMDEAKAEGAMALFGEKYGDEVRVLSMGIDNFSVELCGGTHVDRTGDIALFKIVNEQGVASGVRRIEAVTGKAAYDLVAAQESLLAQLADQLKAQPANLLDKLDQVLQGAKRVEKELAGAKAKLAAASSGELVNRAVEVGGIKVLAIHVEGTPADALRELSDKLKEKLGSGVLLLAANDGDKIALVAGVTKDLTAKLKAGDLMRFVAPQLDGKGGGRPDMAQGGGTGLAKLPQVLAGIPTWVEEQTS
ncbi:alanine--tRNA ligase [Umboniibacter marinipuniceus]|uniref:Alanine--tRNA ligase n=1 Tax=Umboniibacter marinipuniceus TaxID=569599 RepID=A0A3M0AF37_9GAMM|nr:alanine--tRNA ligase [Umboniibacter marinipuniceus]RMA81368.1 alanyl-tRNA synthetase [Umboniibacter marinipuniceus]